MKKKLISVISVLVLVFGTYTVAMADNTTGNATKNSLKSFGNVVYTDGENSVEIYSEDLYKIADRIDLFKNAIADQLAEQNTYFTSADKGTELTSNSSVNIVHTAPSESDAVDPLILDFDTLLEGLAASQSIPTDVTEYGYSEGTNFYKTSDGELTTDGTKENAEQIEISAATPENLSAGSAAWVNGELILGTGADNKAYYNSGYTDGYAEIENASIEYIRHSHSEECYHNHASSCYSTCTATFVKYSYSNNHTTSGGSKWSSVHFIVHHDKCGKGNADESYNVGNHDGTISQVPASRKNYTHSYLICKLPNGLACGYSEGQITEAIVHFN